MSLVVVVGESLLQHVLTAWVEEIERLVKDDELRPVEQCRYDADFLFVGRMSAK